MQQKRPTGSLPPAVPFAITQRFRPCTYTSDDSYIYQLSLVLATATVSFLWAFFFIILRSTFVRSCVCTHLRLLLNAQKKRTAPRAESTCVRADQSKTTQIKIARVGSQHVCMICRREFLQHDFFRFIFVGLLVVCSYVHVHVRTCVFCSTHKKNTHIHTQPLGLACCRRTPSTAITAQSAKHKGAIAGIIVLYASIRARQRSKEK